MKHLWLILVLNIFYYGRASLESQDEGLRRGRHSEGVGKKLPEKHKLSSHKHLKQIQSNTEEYDNINRPRKQENQNPITELKKPKVKQLFAHEYFRVDSTAESIHSNVSLLKGYDKKFNQIMDTKTLYGKDYYRIDSDESIDVLKGPIQGNVAGKEESEETKRYEEEIAAGDITELFGTNPHYYQPEGYRDLGRRFVFSYPYTEIKENQDSGYDEDAEDSELQPIMAPPELVLAVAKHSAIVNDAKSVYPTEHQIDKNMLRDGQYWNSYWKEDFDPERLSIRTSKQNKMRSIKTKLSPGTDIYEYVSQLKQENPKLLYVINKKNI